MRTEGEIPLHLIIALGELGVAEWPGNEHNPEIQKYHAATTLTRHLAKKDETAYCGSFQAWVMTAAGFVPPEKAHRARSWVHFGAPRDEPELGDICVIRRRKRGSDARTGSWGGWHVGQWMDRTRGGIVMLSANVMDRVGIDYFSTRSWEVKAIRMAA